MRKPTRQLGRCGQLSARYDRCHRRRHIQLEQVRFTRLVCWRCGAAVWLHRHDSLAACPRCRAALEWQECEPASRTRKRRRRAGRKRHNDFNCPRSEADYQGDRYPGFAWEG